MQSLMGKAHVCLKMGRLNFTVNYSAEHDPTEERDWISIGLKALAIVVLAGGLTAVGFMMNDGDVMGYLQAVTIR